MLFILPLSFINTCWTSKDFKISSQLRLLRRRSAPFPTRRILDFFPLAPMNRRRTVEEIFQDYQARRQGVLKALTKGTRTQSLSILISDVWLIFCVLVVHQMWRGSRRSVVQVIQPRKSCCNWVVFSSKTEFWFCFTSHFVVVIVCVACCRCNRAFCLE